MQLRNPRTAEYCRELTIEKNKRKYLSEQRWACLSSCKLGDLTLKASLFLAALCKVKGFACLGEDILGDDLRRKKEQN